ncbi:MAG: PilW family protein [Lentimonas sp.]
MIISSKSGPSSTSLHICRSAFTLVEVMVTVTILSIVMASILSTTIFFSKNVASMGNYSSMSRDSRNALEILARDLHGAETVTVATASTLIVVLPVDLGGSTVAYVYDSLANTVTRSCTDASGTLDDILFNDVSDFQFYYYNRLGNVPLDPITAKSVQVKATLVKKVITLDTTDYIISARFLMRNI